MLQPSTKHHYADIKYLRYICWRLRINNKINERKISVKRSAVNHSLNRNKSGFRFKEKHRCGPTSQSSRSRSRAQRRRGQSEREGCIYSSGSDERCRFGGTLSVSPRAAGIQAAAWRAGSTWDKNTVWLEGSKPNGEALACWFRPPRTAASSRSAQVKRLKTNYETL